MINPPTPQGPPTIAEAIETARVVSIDANKLIKEKTALHAERPRIAAIISETEAKKAKLLASGAFENARVKAELSDCFATLSIAPAKARQIEERLEEIERIGSRIGGRGSVALRPVWDALLAELLTKYDKLVSKLPIPEAKQQAAAFAAMQQSEMAAQIGEAKAYSGIMSQAEAAAAYFETAVSLVAKVTAFPAQSA